MKGAPQVPSLLTSIYKTVIKLPVMGRLCHWTLHNTYYIRPHCQDTESNQLYLIHRNKHSKTAKVSR